MSDRDDSGSAFQLKHVFPIEWQNDNEIARYCFPTSIQRFSPPQDKATVWKDVVTPIVEEKRLMAWNSAGRGQNNRKTFYDIIIQDSSPGLKFLLLWSSWYTFFVGIASESNFVALSYWDSSIWKHTDNYKMKQQNYSFLIKNVILRLWYCDAPRGKLTLLDGHFSTKRWEPTQPNSLIALHRDLVSCSRTLQLGLCCHGHLNLGRLVEGWSH